MKLPVVDDTAPAERLAAFRIILATFSVAYLVIRFPVFLGRNGRADDAFDGVGVLWALDAPPPRALLSALVVVGVFTGVGVVVGFRYRVVAPLFATVMVVLTTSRSSWGQLLHFENLMVLHLAVMAFAPAADAWSFDARRDRAAQRVPAAVPLGPQPPPVGPRASPVESVRYGWPLGTAGLVTVVSYVIAGIAKLRYGGADWIVGDTLQNHIAYSAARLDLIGGTPAPLAEFAVRQAWILPVMAAVSVIVELTAPVAFVGGRVRDVWVVSAWLMHVAILATMSIGFPSPLFGVAFAPFYALEKLRGPLVSAWAGICRFVRPGVAGGV